MSSSWLTLLIDLRCTSDVGLRTSEREKTCVWSTFHSATSPDSVVDWRASLKSFEICWTRSRQMNVRRSLFWSFDDAGRKRLSMARGSVLRPSASNECSSATTWLPYCCRCFARRRRLLNARCSSLVMLLAGGSGFLASSSSALTLKKDRAVAHLWTSTDLLAGCSVSWCMHLALRRTGNAVRLKDSLELLPKIVLV